MTRCIKPGDTLLGMNLAHGGHLTHGHPLNFSGKIYKIVPYGVTQETETIDYDELEQTGRARAAQADRRRRQRLSAHHRFRPHARRSRDKVGAMLTGGHGALRRTGRRRACIPRRCRTRDFVTTTTHKTLRGPRGGMILSQSEYAKDLDKTVFPGMQGGPLMHMIAAKAVCFQEALQPEFQATTQQQIVANAKVLARDAGRRKASASSPAARTRT